MAPPATGGGPTEIGVSQLPNSRQTRSDVVSRSLQTLTRPEAIPLRFDGGKVFSDSINLVGRRFTPEQLVRGLVRRRFRFPEYGNHFSIKEFIS